MLKKCARLLFEDNGAQDEGDGDYFVLVELEWPVQRIFGSTGDESGIVLVFFDSLYQDSLVPGAYRVDFVPLPEGYGVNTLTGYDVSAIVFRRHRVSLNSDEEVRSPEFLHCVEVFYGKLLKVEGAIAGDGIIWDERDSRAIATFCLMSDRP